MTKVKSILFKVKAKGRGIVNFNGNETKKVVDYYNFNTENYSEKTPKNSKFAKKILEDDGNGNIIQKIMVSSYCIGYNLFNEEMPFSSSVLNINPEYYMPFISTKTGLLKGWLFPRSGNVSLVKKSPIMLTDYIQTNGAIAVDQVRTTAGLKSDTSFFKEEHVGDIEYESMGAVSLKDLQFISLSTLNDDLAFPPESYETSFLPIFKKQYPNFNSKMGYYRFKDQINPLSKLGVVLDNDTISDIIKYFFKKLMTLNIRKKSSYLENYEVSIKLVTDPLKSNFSDEEGWMVLNSDLLDNLSIDVYDYYEQVDEKDAILFNDGAESLAKDIIDKMKKGANKRGGK